MKIALLKLVAALILSLCAACGGELSEEGVLNKLAPSLVNVQSGSLYGASGFLVKGNYIVTAAHVVWGLPGIDVLLHDGTLLEDVPVIAYDYFSDLAFLGPIDTSAPPLQFAEIDSFSSEDKAFIIGDPIGPGGNRVSEGNFYSTWEWPEANTTILYVSAEAKSGMSGGPITNGEGEVMGVLVRRSGKEFAGGPSSDTVKDRLEKLGRGEDITILGNRELPDAREGSQEFEFVLRDRWDTATFVSVGSTHSLEFDSYRDVEYGFFDIGGNGVFTPDFRTAQESLTDRCCITGPGFVEVRQRFDLERHVTLKSTTPLVRHTDPDDGRPLRFGETIAGAFDTPGDIDRYTIDLSGGESVSVRLSGLRRMLVTIEHGNAPPYEVGSGEVYWDEIKYRAPVDSTYTIAVRIQPTDFSYPLGYTLSVLKSWVKPNLNDRSGELRTHVGNVRLHRFQDQAPNIRISYPANITGGDKKFIATELFEQDRWGRTATLEKRDLSHHREEPDELLTVADYMERSVLSSSFPYKTEKTVTARREIETPSGEPVLIEDFEVDNGGMKGVRLAYIHEGETGYMAIFYAPSQVFDEWRPVVDYCIGTFSIGEFSVADGMSDG